MWLYVCKKLLTFIFVISLVSIAFSLDYIKKSRAQALNIEEANARKLEEINFVTKVVGNCIRWREEIEDERYASGEKLLSFTLAWRVKICNEELANMIVNPRNYMSQNKAAD